MKGSRRFELTFRLFISDVILCAMSSLPTARGRLCFHRCLSVHNRPHGYSFTEANPLWIDQDIDQIWWPEIVAVSSVVPCNRSTRAEGTLTCYFRQPICHQEWIVLYSISLFKCDVDDNDNWQQWRHFFVVSEVVMNDRFCAHSNDNVSDR